MTVEGSPAAPEPGPTESPEMAAARKILKRRKIGLPSDPAARAAAIAFIRAELTGYELSEAEIDRLLSEEDVASDPLKSRTEETREHVTRWGFGDGL